MVLQAREGNSQAVDPGSLVAEEEVKIPIISIPYLRPLHTFTLKLHQNIKLHNENKGPRIKAPVFFTISNLLINQSTILNTCLSLCIDKLSCSMRLLYSVANS